MKKPIALIFMNEKIKDPKNKSKKMIRLQVGDVSVDNERISIPLVDNGRLVIRCSLKPTRKIKSHAVRAWIEVYR